MRLKDHLIALGEWDEERHAAMDEEVAAEVKTATKQAQENGILGHGLHHPFRSMFEDSSKSSPGT